MKRYAIKQSKFKQLAVFLLCAFATLISVSLLMVESDNGILGILINRILPLIGIGLFGYFTLTGYKRVLNPVDLVIIDRTGVLDTTTQGGPESITWEDVSEIDYFTYDGAGKRVTKLAIKVKDFDGYVAKVNKDRRDEILSSAVLNRGVLNIDISATDADPMEVFQMAKEHFEAINGKSADIAQ